MKKLTAFLVPASMLLLCAGLIFASPASFAQQTAKAAKGIVIPKKVNKILTASCLPCHSDAGRAKRALNLSQWNTYDPATQLQKVNNIGNEVSRGKMPPPMFVENNPKQALTAKQKALIAKWIKSSASAKE